MNAEAKSKTVEASLFSLVSLITSKPMRIVGKNACSCGMPVGSGIKDDESHHLSPSLLNKSALNTRIAMSEILSQTVPSAHRTLTSLEKWNAASVSPAA